jgi:AraC-like DNA-binding protein
MATTDQHSKADGSTDATDGSGTTPESRARALTLYLTEASAALSADPRLARAWALIDSKYDEERLGLSDMATTAALSKSQLMRLFRKVTRKTPHQILDRRRVLKAAELLANTDITVADTAMAVGFGSINAFRDALKNFIGTSPIDFKKRCRRPKNADFLGDNTLSSR